MTLSPSVPRYPDVFLDTMMHEELGLMPPDDADCAWKNGLVTFAAFEVFGFVPLIRCFQTPRANRRPQPLLWLPRVAVVVVAAISFASPLQLTLSPLCAPSYLAFTEATNAAFVTAIALTALTMVALGMAKAQVRLGGR